MAWQDSDITGGKVRLKHSQVAAETIGPSGLVPGEIAINSADGSIHYLASDGTVALMSLQKNVIIEPASATETITVASSPRDVLLITDIAAGTFTTTINLPSGQYVGQTISVVAKLLSGTQVITVNDQAAEPLFSFTNTGAASRGVVVFVWSGTQWLDAAPQIIFSDQGGGGGGALTDALAYYSFDGATPTADLSGNSLALTAIGTPTYATGVIGNAASFNGSNSALKTSLSPFSGNTSMSISLWAKTSAADLNFSIGTRPDADAAGSFRLISVSDTTLVFQVNGDNNCVGSWQNDGTWQHLAATYDGTSSKLYVNGSLVQTLALVGATLGSSFPLLIGAANWDSAGTEADLFADCSVDEVAVYGFALTGAQVLELYAGGDGFNPYA